MGIKLFLETTSRIGYPTQRSQVINVGRRVDDLLQVVKSVCVHQKGTKARRLSV